MKVHNLLMVPVGAWSLVNSDLVERLKEGAPLNEADPAIFFGAGKQGLYGLSYVKELESQKG